jgi:hypothetical protein
MSFQWIINTAQDIQISKRAVVAQTITRNQTVRAVSRGGRVWRFSVTPAAGHRWQDPNVRNYIEQIDRADRFTPTNINFAGAGLSYLFGYQGGQTSTSGWSAAATQGSDIISVSGGSLTSGFRYKSGDILQFQGSTKVYSVVIDVPFNSSTVRLNRPVLEATGNYTLVTGTNCTWRVLCQVIPDYRITQTGIIEWSGPFEFIESI